MYIGYRLVKALQAVQVASLEYLVMTKARLAGIQAAVAVQWII